MKSYRKYPPSPPSSRSIWILVGVFAAVLIANLVHQAL